MQLQILLEIIVNIKNTLERKARCCLHRNSQKEYNENFYLTGGVISCF
jgi:hypothetical protein